MSLHFLQLTAAAAAAAAAATTSCHDAGGNAHPIGHPPCPRPPTVTRDAVPWSSTGAHAEPLQPQPVPDAQNGAHGCWAAVPAAGHQELPAAAQERLVLHSQSHMHTHTHTHFLFSEFVFTFLLWLFV